MISFKRPKLLAKSLMLLDSAFTIQAQERAEKKRQEYEQIKEYNNEHFNSYYQVPHVVHHSQIAIGSDTPTCGVYRLKASSRQVNGQRLYKRLSDLYLLPSGKLHF